MASFSTEQLAFALIAASQDFDYECGGFSNLKWAILVLACVGSPWVEIENSGDLFRIFNAARREYFWPADARAASWAAAINHHTMPH